MAPAGTATKAPAGYEPINVRQFSFIDDGISLEGEYIGRRDTTVQKKPAVRHTFKVVSTNHPDFKEGDLAGCLETVQMADGLLGAQPGDFYFLKRTGKKKGGQGSFFEMEIFKRS